MNNKINNNTIIVDGLLEKINPNKKYEELSNKFNGERTPSSNRLVYIDGEIFEECVCKIHGDDDFKFNTHDDKFFKKGIKYAQVEHPGKNIV